MKKIILLASVTALAVLLLVASGPFGLNAADHREAPLADGAGEVDIADVYVFGVGSGNDVGPHGCQSRIGPHSACNTVLVMTVNPLSLPAAAASYAFADTGQKGEYWFYIDNTGDAIPDVAYCLTFSARGAGASTPQEFKLYRQSGVVSDGCVTGTLVAQGNTTPGTASVTPAPRVIVPVTGGGSAFAGPANDPFFFDLVAFNRVFCCGGSLPRATPSDSFLGVNASAIVLEVPTSALTNGTSWTKSSGSLCTAASCIGVWARTKQNDVVIDRMGRPAIATVLIPFNQRDAFNQTKPQDDDALWKPTMNASLVALGNCTPGLAGFLSPDTLTYNTATPGSGFPNGRKLADDVIDTELGLITFCIGITTDGIPLDADNAQSASFPYVALPGTAAP